MRGCKDAVAKTILQLSDNVYGTVYFLNHLLPV